jgi:hypothetical protein
MNAATVSVGSGGVTFGRDTNGSRRIFGGWRGFGSSRRGEVRAGAGRSG